MQIVIIILGILCDRITKIWASTSVKNTNNGYGFQVINNIFDFRYVENRGAAWGIFENKLIFLTLITFLVICGMLFYVIKYRPKSKLFKVSFSLIIAGALGNLFDRIHYKYVIDFIYFHYKDVYSFPVFNVADMMVVCGTFLLAFYILKEGK